MDQFLDTLGEWLRQAYVYIPAILAFISSIGFPSLVQIAKIVSSVKLYVTQISVVFRKMNETLDEVNKLSDFVLTTLDEDAAFFEAMAETTYNKKQKQMFMERAETIRGRKSMAFRKIESLKEDVAQKKKKVKVKVRIKPEASSDEARAE